MRTIERETALRIAESLIGRRPEHVEPYRPAVGGDDSHSFRLWAAGRPLLLKVKKRPGTPVGVYFHRRIREAGVPVPELVAFAPDAGPQGQACAVWQWIEGVPADWRPGEPCPYDEAEFGGLLRRIHELRFDGPYGMLGDDPPATGFRSHPDLGPVSRTWAGFFHCDRAARLHLQKGYLTEAEAEVLADLPRQLSPELDCASCRLLHMGDIMHNGNMILDGATGRIRAVVDYVESVAGDPRWELAWVDYYFGQPERECPAFDMARFRAAYGTDHDPEDRLGRFYLLAILVFEKLLFLGPDSARGRRAIQAAKQIIRELGATGRRRPGAPNAGDTPMNIREMDRSEAGRLGEIDRTEHVTVGYTCRDGRLRAEPVDWRVPPWSPEGDGEHTVTHHVQGVRATLAAGGRMFGAFDGDRLVAMAVLCYELEPGVAELAGLWVGQGYRRRGIATQLLARVEDRAREHGARRLYVSATPSESAVGFYTSRGFRPAEQVHPDLYALEPEDIHMIKTL